MSENTGPENPQPFSLPPEAQGVWWKSMTANALGMIIGVTRAVGWDEDEFLDRWLADRDAASEELCERIDEHLQELAVEQLRRQLDEKGEG